MKNTDKYLIGIVVGIVLLVVVVFAFVLTLSEPSYQAEDTPEGVAYNYLLALERGEDERALSYLSSCVLNRPTQARIFNSQIENNWSFRNLERDTSLQVLSSEVAGIEAVVVVQETVFKSGAPFDNSADSDEFTMTLILQEGSWKLVAGEKYWSYKWQRKPDCP